jgi:hypothetical protein
MILQTRHVGQVHSAPSGFNQYRHDWIEYPNGEWKHEYVLVGVNESYDDGHDWITRPSRQTVAVEVEGYGDEETLTDNGEAVYDSDEYATADEYPAGIDGDVLLYGEANEMRGPWGERE